MSRRPFGSARLRASGRWEARYTPNRSGYYKVFGQVTFAASTGSRLAQVRKNSVETDAAPYAAFAAPAGIPGAAHCSGIIQLNGTTDYLELWGWQDSGAALSTAYASGLYGSYLLAELLGAV